MHVKKNESIKFKTTNIVYQDRRGDFKIIHGTAYNESGTTRLYDCTIKGSLPDVETDDELFATGYWEDHPKYGRSFKATAYIKCIPSTKENILNYLCNGNISGITKIKAKNIVDTFGVHTFDILLHSPERLMQVKGIGEKSIEKISNSAKKVLEQQTVMSAIMMYIQMYGISPAYTKRIYERYGEKSIEVIRKNPYQLAEDVKGIGFLKADAIALHNGIKLDSPYRVESAVMYILKQMKDNGDVFGTMEQVVEQGCTFLDIDRSHITAAIQRLLQNQKLKKRDNDLYLPQLYYAEARAAKNFVRIAEAKKGTFTVTDKEIIEFGEKLQVHYADAQVKAIRTACSSSITIITGGPGTGKTTITNGVIQLCRKHLLRVKCAAPTGKAAKRMAEATGTDAKTIHKLLEPYYDEEKRMMIFSKDESSPLDTDVLIVDECSMIDICLFDSLLKAIRVGTKLILVGDIDQLPSVGCGTVLKDVIVSQTVPVERLSVIFRQEEQSQIVQNANMINHGHMPVLKNKKNGDFFFINVKDMEQEAVRDMIVHYTCENLPRYYGVDPDEVQILAPMKKGHTGVYELNNFVQEKRHPEKDSKFLVSGGNIFYEGDKVMCTSNDYEYLLLNGDIGKIIQIKTDISDEDDDRYFVVDFDGSIKKLPLQKIENFTLAYAMTIHKSQGSEYEIVVMVLTNHNYIMLQRNLLYTGLTRAKKVFVLFGEESAIRRAVKTVNVVNRNSHLDTLILKAKKTGN